MRNLTIPKHHIIGHRGVAGLRPENTICSFKYAAELGLDWIEFDVQLTKDDHWVVMHDETVDRTTNGRGLVNDLTIYDITEMEAGLWFRPSYPNEKVPTLLETLQLAKKLNLFCDVEIKNIKGPKAEPKKFADLFAAFVSAQPDVTENILVTSFDFECLVELRAFAPELMLGFNIENFTSETIPLCQKHNFANINCNVKKFTQDNLKAAKQAQIPVFLYTVNDQTTANFWIERGVQGIFSDRPDLLVG